MNEQISINDLIDVAPEKIQDIIYATETAHILFEIEKKNSVDNNGVANKIIGQEVSFVLLGLTHPRDFVGNLIKNIPTDRETAKNIARDINREIFSDIKDLLMNIHGITPSSKDYAQKNVPTPQFPSSILSPKKLTSPKPTVLTPFTDQAESATKYSESKEAAMPKAPVPPTNYVEVLSKVDNIQDFLPKTTTNPFEVLLKEKLQSQLKSKETPEPVPTASLASQKESQKEKEIVVPVPPTSSATKSTEHGADNMPTNLTPQLHTTIAKAVNTPREKKSPTSTTTTADPYREAI